MTSKPLPIPSSDPHKAAALAMAARYYETRDPALLNQLVKNHMAMVAKMAKSLGGYHVPLEDLVSEGTLALIQAIHKFDPAKTKGASFATYASYWIRNAMKEFIMRNHNIVAVTPTPDTKPAFFRVRTERNKLAAANGGVLPHNYRETIAATLGVSLATVTHVEARLTSDVPADLPLPSNENLTLIDTFTSADPVLESVPSPEDLVSESQERAYLRSLLGRLSDRERLIVTERILAANPPTIARLAQQLGVAPQRVHQIEARALKKLKAASAASIAATTPVTTEHTDA